MPEQFSHSARFFAALIAIAVFGSLAVQITINLEPGVSPLVTFGLMLRFFTIWTNLAAGLLMAWVAIRGDADSRALFSLATAIIIVGSVYHLLLAAEHQPVGADWWTNQMFHTVIPAATVLWWLAFSRLSKLGWRSLPVVMLVPVAYTIFALINGALTDFHPYFFLNLPALGWVKLLVNMAGLSALFLLIAAILLAARRFIGKAFAS